MEQTMLDQESFSMIQSQSRLEQEQKDLETLLSTFGENEENQQDLNFSQDNNVVPKKSISKRRSDYSNTKVKTRNLLTMLHIDVLNNLILTIRALLLTFYHFWYKISIL